MLLKAANDPVYKTPELALTNAGMCMSRAGRIDEAEKYFRQVLTRKPRYGDALLQLADLDFQRGTKQSLDEASALIKRYLAVVAAAGPRSCGSVCAWSAPAATTQRPMPMPGA